MPRIAAVILAGGEARRMGGGDKPLLPVGGQSMLARIVTSLTHGDVAISANGDPARFASLGVPVLPDGAFAGRGPLAGVLAGLDRARAIGAEALLTIPGDTPFVPTGLAEALWPPPACAASNGQPHHLVALWPLGCRDALHAFLSGPSSLRVGGFACQIGMRLVDFPIREWDPFLNVNTPDDLVRARALIGERSAGGMQ